jgi:DNA-binding MarR family transcriptional regulator
MPQRTVRTALEQPTEAALVTAQPSPYDTRKQIYAVTPAGRDAEQ